VLSEQFNVEGMLVVGFTPVGALPAMNLSIFMWWFEGRGNGSVSTEHARVIIAGE
jgi:hypothetical protein